MAEFMMSLVTALAALLVGLWLVYVCSRHLKVDSGALLVAVLFAPALLFLGLSGRLVEFKGLGIEAKFREVAAKKVSPTTLLKPMQESPEKLEKDASRNAFFSIGKDVVVLRAPRNEKLGLQESVAALAQQIQPGIVQGRFEALVILDAKDRVLGYFTKEYFYDLLPIEQIRLGSSGEAAKELLTTLLEHTELWIIAKDPEVRAESEGQRLLLATADTNLEALKKLAAANQQIAIATSPSGKYSGLVRRTDIVAELLGALSSP